MPPGNRSTPTDSAIPDDALCKRDANHVALTPLSFLRHSATVFPDKTAVIYGNQRTSYGELYARCIRLASAINRSGVCYGETVSILAPNVPVLLEAHFGIGMAGAVLNAINTRLDAGTIGFILAHAGSRLLIVDTEYLALAAEAIRNHDLSVRVITWDDPEIPGTAGSQTQQIATTDYESFLDQGDPDWRWQRPDDEWDSLSLNYTSGTTGNPKGVVYSHRGAYLNSLGNVITFGVDRDSVYLWTLPMFHCNGWTYTWAVTAVAGTHVCLRKVDQRRVFDLIREHQVSHLCGAPIVLNMLAGDADPEKDRLPHTVNVATGGAAPPTAIISALEKLGFRVTHLYGLTESYGPSAVGLWQEGWEDLSVQQRGAMIARQGVNTLVVEDMIVADPGTLEEAPRDGRTMGEILLRGNTIMKGYLHNNEATEESLAGGWFRTGDLAVRHPDGYVEIKDRSKDIIISGGENISSLEVEEVLYAHPGIAEAAVVARADDKWGEIPCAFVTPRPGHSLSIEEVVGWCRDRMAKFKVPKRVVFEALPKTSTGKIQKHLLRERAEKLQ